MLLRTVRIQNFRALREIEIDLEPTTVLIGENNSGKTSLLHAIRLALSRSGPRRGAPFEEYDYHLASKVAHPTSAQPVSITLDFAEARPDEWREDLVRETADITVIGTDDERHITLRLTSKFDSSLGEFASEWNFLDAAGNPLSPKVQSSQIRNRFLQLVPFFYLSALRDATREFSGRAEFWGPFIREHGMPDDVRERLQETLAELNEQVLNAHSSLQMLRKHLARVQSIVSLGFSEEVEIEAIPGRIFDLLSRTQVNVTAQTGASLPLTRHGAGTQSLSVLFLFDAFVTSFLGTHYGKLSEPILALEEPEAHLHPSATRALWDSLVALGGQKLIATHSGDLLARVPLSSIRRFYRTAEGVQVGRLRKTTLADDEHAKVEFHLSSSRGELLFAKTWLLVEGETEYWVYRELAAILGCDLDRIGVRIVTYQWCGVEPLLKVAGDFGISWFVSADGDAEGLKAKAIAERYLGGEPPSQHLAVLPRENMELYLCSVGLGAAYENHISPQKRHQVTAKPTDPEYWTQVLEARDRLPKPLLVLEVIEQMRQAGSASVPPELRTTVEAVRALAER